MTNRFILYISILFLLPYGLSGNESYMLEDGHSLWLRYHPMEDERLRDEYHSYFKTVYLDVESSATKVIRDELSRAFPGFFGSDPIFADTLSSGCQLSITLSKSTDPGYSLLEGLKKGGYLIQVDSTERVIEISALTDAGLVYGTFHLLRLLQQRESLGCQPIIVEEPAVDLRMLNQWDNLDGSVERGYSGRSIYQWDDLTEGDHQRLIDFARANASIGINAIAINNVNADPNILKPENLEKVERIARIFRPYGIRIFLSANFAAPMKPSSTPHAMKRWGGIGTLTTSDPLDTSVIRWWKEKIEEIYSLIPDFGGFLVKANSEGMPGPQDYGRSHAEGANLFARLLKPHGGILIWRAFVYGKQADESDRVKQAYQEFKPLDGHFESNVLLQVKNGPLDFQPSEPPSPLFGAMVHTNLMPELQITQEYLGHSVYLVYLGGMWQQFFRFDTRQSNRHPSTIADLVTSDKQPFSGVAGVANVGNDRNWTGHHFAQANWYLFGRMAWNPAVDNDQLVREWIQMTWSTDQLVRESIWDIMRHSLDRFIDLQTPFGLPVTVDRGKHFDPSFHSRNGLYWYADRSGIGYDRTASGSGFVNQYHPLNSEKFSHTASCPEAYLLFFHFLPWDYRFPDGEALRDRMLRRNRESLLHLKEMCSRWKLLEGEIDSQRHAEVSRKMERQLTEAKDFAASLEAFVKERTTH